MNVLSLFSGGGLGDYGLTLAGMEIAGQVEIDEYCQKILKLRWPDVPKWGDIKNVTGKEIIERCGRIDLISGGFPCQDISIAKITNRKGLNGERSGLWSEMFRIICEVRPRYVLVENVTALLDGWLGIVLSDLASIGFDAEWECLPASAFGAAHVRDRVWIVAYPGCWNGQRDEIKRKPSKQNKARDAFESERSSFSGQLRAFGTAQGIRETYERERWKAEPTLGRVVDECPKRMDRLAILGNGWDIRPAEWIGKRIMEFDQSLEGR